MVGFLLGENFVLHELREHGKKTILLSIGESVMTAFTVSAALLITMPLTGISPAFALLLGGIAPASAPAAILETIRERRADGPLSRSTLRVVALDDAWGVIIFSLFFVLAQLISEGSATGGRQLLEGLWEVGGALLVGAAVGLPMAWVTPRVRRGETTLIEAMGFVFVAVGLAAMLDVSYLLSAMVTGIVVANLAHGSRRPFHAVEGVREPFMAVFFVLSGFELELSTLATLGAAALVYALGRILGKLGGTYLGGRLLGAEPVVRNRLGICIMPQAGVALGFALLAQQQLPELGSRIINIVIATTILFEASGPFLLRWQISAAGEAGQADGSEA
jgi:Kef-type K+ transport system membrane component KefB